MRVADLLRQHWKLAAAAAVVLLVAAVALLRAITGEAPTDPGDLRPPAMAASSDIQFQQLGRAMTREILAYDERRADFELGRIDCASLTLGHTEVSQAFIAYSERFAIVGTRLAAADRSEYQRLAGEARAATRHFEQAGCSSG